MNNIGYDSYLNHPYK